MKKIVVATDFSPTAFNAAKYAAYMAMAVKAELTLFHVYAIPAVYSEMPTAVNTEEMRLVAEKKMNELVAQLKAETRGWVQAQTEIRMGGFYQELKSVCEYLQPYAVVMGNRSTTTKERLLFGNYAVYAMKHLPWPLITVPPSAAFLAVRKIGLVCDLDKATDDTPIDEIKMMVHDFKAELHVLNIGKERIFDPNTVFEPDRIQNILEDLRPIYDYVTDANTDECILQFAKENNIDLLLILPKRASFFETLVHKNNIKHFVLHSHVPVMALHLAIDTDHSS